MSSTTTLPRLLGASLFVLAMSCPCITHAGEPAAGTHAARTDGPSAEQLAEQAFKAYEAGDFGGAVGLYMQSFQISGDARVLFNVASIYDKKLHDRALAEDFYRRYLKSTTTEPELVKKANDRLVELKKESETSSNDKDAKGAAPPRHDEPPPPRQEPQTSTFPWRPVGLGLAGVGVVGVAIGAIFGLSALSKADDLKTTCPNDVCPDEGGPTLRDDAASAATASTILFTGGLVLVAGGAALFFLAPKTATTTNGVRMQPNVGRTGAGFALSGSF
jgi:hypothetical protein